MFCTVETNVKCDQASGSNRRSAGNESNLPRKPKGNNASDNVSNAPNNATRFHNGARKVSEVKSALWNITFLFIFYLDPMSLHFLLVFSISFYFFIRISCLSLFFTPTLCLLIFLFHCLALLTLVYLSLGRSLKTIFFVFYPLHNMFHYYFFALRLIL